MITNTREIPVVLVYLKLIFPSIIMGLLVKSTVASGKIYHLGLYDVNLQHAGGITPFSGD